MSAVLLHAGELHLPMALEDAGVALGIGLAVVLAVAYDYFRNDWNGGA